ncbi:restriction endonuclease subunit S [Leuconostoc kimchii]|uniref:Restriction endonuclease subunit S n=1 Tax=Leuconostoc kimchii TaxID=136609 RepID=A0ABX5SIJ1_9LACO|nr:restriction endonuclease subunit S [Leuconostoc kimchii]QBR47179.1 restriction endonuclease subunit S [Leuconostoc kimchii]
MKNEHEKAVPELRFPGYTDAWVKHSIKDIFKVTRGSVLAASETLSNPAKGSIYPVYSSQTKNDGLLGYYHEFLFEDAITWTTDGANAGTVKYRKNKFYSTNVNGVLIGNFANKATAEALNKVAYKFVSKVGNPKLMNNVMSNIEIYFPELTEQLEISKVFDILDQQIAVNERKVKNLKLMKKSLLQKMFPKDGSEYPELRFPEYTDAWVKRQFKELYRKNLEKNNIGISTARTISIATMQFKMSGNGAASSSIASYKVLRVGDIAFEGHTSKKFSFGRFVLNDIGDGIMSPRFTTLRPTQKMPISFWKQYINNEHIMRYPIVRSTKLGTMMNELVISDLEKQLILVPSIDEQTKIGTFFQMIDQLITVNERKVQHLKKQKKALLQKMFV